MNKRKPFMGYGSPEALEQAIKRDESDDFVVYGEGLLYASVCSSFSQEIVIERMSRRICGTTNGWQFSEETFKGGESNPCPCSDNPETHQHFLFIC